MSKCYALAKPWCQPQHHRWQHSLPLLPWVPARMFSQTCTIPTTLTSYNFFKKNTTVPVGFSSWLQGTASSCVNKLSQIPINLHFFFSWVMLLLHSSSISVSTQPTLVGINMATCRFGSTEVHKYLCASLLIRREGLDGIIVLFFSFKIIKYNCSNTLDSG